VGRRSQVLRVQFLVLSTSLVYRSVGAVQSPDVPYFLCHILKVRCWFPAVVLWWVSFPLNQICGPFFVVFQNFLNFVILLFCFLAIGGCWVRCVSGVECFLVCRWQTRGESSVHLVSPTNNFQYPCDGAYRYGPCRQESRTSTR
jgi:hypothetical protein